MKQWINKTVRLNDSWGPGAAHTLTTPLGQQPEFSLHPRYMRDGLGNLRLTHFTVDFPSGFLADGWQGVNFTPIGKDDATGISGLPEWETAHREKYRNAIKTAAGPLAHAHTARLEGVVPYISEQGDVGYNVVRLFYVKNAVQGPIADLVVVKVVSHIGIPGLVQGRQDGDGHGPPR